MKRYSNMEILTAIGGLILILFGLVMVFSPDEMTLISPGFGAGRYRGMSGSGTHLHISKTESMVYGGLSVMLGIGIIWMALFSNRKR